MGRGPVGYGPWRRPDGPSLGDILTNRRRLLLPASASGGGPDRTFPSFTSRSWFPLDKPITWYPPHMSRASVDMCRQLRNVDALVEVRDCRAPLSSANEFVTHRFGPKLLQANRLVLLNKADLVDWETAQKSKNLIQAAGIPCLLSVALKSTNIAHINEFVRQHCKAKHKSIGMWIMLVGLPNTGKSSVLNAMKRMAFATAKHSRPGNKIVKGITHTKAVSGALPGSTKIVSKFAISNDPKIYCIDTPGIMIPKKNDPEVSMKLAALGCINDHWAGETLIADYVLYKLNSRRQFDYVDALELYQPSDDIYQIAEHIKALMQRSDYLRTNFSLSGMAAFLKLFRNGHFGSICLDDLPDQFYCRAADSDLQLTEPPGPWGPRQYVESTVGLG